MCSHCATPGGRVLSAATRQGDDRRGMTRDEASEYFSKFLEEPVAQPVEQLTFNQ
jgi:hypothetical protein